VSDTVTVYLGLGSNLGNRQENLDQALKLLALRMRLGKVSAIYDTEPIGNINQPRFLNLVCQVYTSLTPMNRLTDAVPPESDLARDFNRRVDLALADQSALQTQSADLRRWLALWRDNHALVQPVLQDSYLLRELEPLSETVSAVAAAGLQALELLEFGRKPSESWSRDQALLLQRAERPQAELLIMIVPGVRKLVAAANQIR
jgi:2-amino-4-hydroxy-6-hydroxymethyldihydropteridine diphosphokinase